MADEQPAKSPSTPDMSWRGAQAETPDRQTLARRKNRWSTVLFGVLLALVSALVVWFLYIGGIPSGAYLLTINIGTYNDPLYPVVPFAKQDSERLKQHFPNTNREAEAKTIGLLRDELNRLAERPEPTLVVHITALALVRGGEVYLLPANANPHRDDDPDRDDTWMKLAHVVDAVGRCPARKLLILDLVHPLADPRLGVLGDRVAETLENYLKNYFKESRPNFLVLCPCSSLETSLTSPILQSSALAYYIDLGLRGGADGAGGGKKDKTITARELAAFVETHVESWARLNRGQRQKPVLFGAGADFPIVSLRRHSAPEMPSVEARAWPEALRKDWQRRDDWFAQRLFASAPDVFQQRVAQLLRQEQRWQGGAPRDISASADDRPDQSLKVQAVSLAAALGQGKTNRDLVELVRDYFAGAAVDMESTKKPDNTAALAKARETLDSKFKDMEFRLKALTIVEALALLTDWERSQARLALDMVQPRLPEHEFVETLYVQELADYVKRVDRQGRKLRGDIVAAVFKAMWAREAVFAAVSEEPSLLPWVASLVKNDADAQRRQGERDFLWQGPLAKWHDAKVHLESAKRKYLAAAERLQTLQQCRRTLDEALAVLPGYAPLLSEWIERDPVAEASWNQAVVHTRELSAFFADPPALDRQADASDQKITDLKDQSDLLRKYLRQLEEKLGTRLAEVEDGSGPETVEQILAVLKCPLLTAKKRAKLHQQADELAKKLQDRSDQEGARPGQGPAKLWNPVAQALVRARLAQDLLSLESAANLDKAANLGQVLAQNITKMDELDPLEKAVRQAWAARSSDSSPATAGKSNREQSWKKLSAWLEENYVAESKHWLADRPLNEPGAKGLNLGTFYRKMALQMQPLD